MRPPAPEEAAAELEKLGEEMLQTFAFSMAEAGNAWQLFAEDLLAALEPVLQAMDELIDLLYPDPATPTTHRLPWLVGLVMGMVGLVALLA